MRIAIIQFPGSNCERETMLAVKRAGMEPVEFLWNEPKDKLLASQGYIIVGGFSYEDRSRAGAIAALDPVMEVIRQQAELGKPVLGICNGAQILVETGLVPGIENHKVGMSLTDNKRIQAGKVLGTGYYNAWINMRLSDHYQYNAFTRLLTPQAILKVPVAHGEGRFIIPSALLSEMQENGLNVFQYCDEKGNIVDEFPINPNGSMNNIAAVSNKAGNVMAMMPHPERTVNGDAIFHSMREYITQGYQQKVKSLSYYPRRHETKKYRKPGHVHELIVELIITDNQALSVENALRHKGLPVKVRRRIHWEIDCNSPEDFEMIKASGVLYNDRKEYVLAPKDIALQNSYLVRPQDDIHGLEKMQQLKDHYGLEGIRSIRYGVLWHLDADAPIIPKILDTHIISNPFAHECYNYE
jgi:phosphoribosylformylglycinamidine synthase